LNRWLIHRLEQLRIHYPDEMLAWFREHTEVVHEPHNHLIVWKEGEP